MSDIVNRLRHRAKTKNGSVPVGASDGGTYTMGYYDQFAAKDDKEAADRIEQLERENAKLRSDFEEMGSKFLQAKFEAAETRREALGALEPFTRYETADGLPSGLLRIDDKHAILFNGCGDDIEVVATIGDFRRAKQVYRRLAEQGGRE